MEAFLKRLVDSFETQTAVSGRAMRTLAGEVPHIFVNSALNVLKSTDGRQGYQYLTSMLLAKEVLLPELLNPGRFSVEAALAVYAQARKIDQRLDVKLMRMVCAAAGIEEDADEGGDALRALEMISAAGASSDVVPFLIRLGRHPATAVRSKVALLLGRTNRNVLWVEREMNDVDPRVRANAVESLWGSDTTKSKDVLWAAARDNNNRVAANGLLGLYLANVLESVPHLLKMARHRSEYFRASAAWAMGVTGDPRFAATLVSMSGDESAMVRTNADRALAAIAENVERARSAGSLLVKLSPPAVQNGKGVFRLAIHDSSNQPLAEVSPTRVSVYAGSEIVEEYEVVDRLAPEIATVGFLLPARRQCSEDFWSTLTSSYEACLPRKRKSDPWSFVRYFSPKAAAKDGKDRTGKVHDRLFGVDFTTEARPAGEEEGGESPEQGGKPSFNLLPAAVAEHFSKADRSTPGTTGLAAAFQRIVPAFAGQPGKRHILIVVPPDPSLDSGADLTQEVMELLAKRLRGSQVTVHAIALESANPAAVARLAEICHMTSGFLWMVPQPAALSETLERFLVALLPHYELTAPCQDACTRLSAMVCHEKGFGLDSLDITGVSNCARILLDTDESHDLFNGTLAGLASLRASLRGTDSQITDGGAVVSIRAGGTGEAS